MKILTTKNKKLEQQPVKKNREKMREIEQPVTCRKQIHNYMYIDSQTNTFQMFETGK